MNTVAVVGASLAGLSAARALREQGFTGELVVVGEETHRPYDRPPLSKELLAGGQTEDGCAFPCDTVDAEWRLGVAATGLDREPAEDDHQEDGDRVQQHQRAEELADRAGDPEQTCHRGQAL